MTDQRASAVRPLDKDSGLASLTYLLSVAEGDTDQAGVVARFLVGLYNGTHFPFNLTELRDLHHDLFAHCLAVLRLDNRPAVEVHRYFTDGSARWQKMIVNWSLDQRPAPAALAVSLASERYNVRYVSHEAALGYRDVTLFVSLGDDPRRKLSIELRFSAEDSARVAQDIFGIHRRAWGGDISPTDVKEGEQRPLWL